MTSRWLDPADDRAWRAYRRMFTLLEAQLAHDLAEDSGLSMADYTVLSNLGEAEDRRWRVTALADHVRWSQSRLSHQLTRMEKRGLVTRGEVEEDGRGAVVSLTKQGLKTIAAATPGHMAAVRKHMIDLLDPSQLAALEEVAATIVNHLNEEVEPSDDSS